MMKIELTEEEKNYLLEVCKRAKRFSERGCHDMPNNVSMNDLEKIETLINKLSEKKCEK